MHTVATRARMVLLPALAKHRRTSMINTAELLCILADCPELRSHSGWLRVPQRRGLGRQLPDESLERVVQAECGQTTRGGESG